MLKSDRKLLLVKLAADGTVDPGFGVAGFLTIAETNPRLNDFVLAPALFVTPDGDLLAQATAFRFDAKLKVTGTTSFTRYRANGASDPGYGDNGSVTTKPNELANALALLPGERLLVMQGKLNSKISTMAVLDRGGAVDPSFGVNGALRLPNPDPANLSTNAIKAVRQDDGNIVLWASSAAVDGPSDYSVPYLIRILPNGKLDASFARIGFVTHNLMPDPAETPSAMVIDRAGKILTAASFSDGRCSPTRPFLLMRWLPDGTPDDTFGDHSVAMP